MFTRISRFAALAATIAAGVTLAACTQTGVPGVAVGPQQQLGQVPVTFTRFVNGSPDAGPVTFSIDGTVVAGPMFYRSIKGLTAIPQGVHTITVTSTATPSAFSARSKTYTFSANRSSIVWAGQKAAATLQIYPFDDPSFTTPAGEVGYLFHDASPALGDAGYEIVAASTLANICYLGNSCSVKLGELTLPPPVIGGFNEIFVAFTASGSYPIFLFYPNPNDSFHVFPSNGQQNVTMYAIDCNTSSVYNNSCPNDNLGSGDVGNAFIIVGTFDTNGP